MAAVLFLQCRYSLRKNSQIFIIMRKISHQTLFNLQLFKVQWCSRASPQEICGPWAWAEKILQAGFLQICRPVREHSWFKLIRQLILFQCFCNIFSTFCLLSPATNWFSKCSYCISDLSTCSTSTSRSRSTTTSKCWSVWVWRTDWSAPKWPRKTAPKSSRICRRHSGTTSIKFSKVQYWFCAVAIKLSLLACGYDGGIMRWGS